MTHRKLRLPFVKRARRRSIRRHDDPADVFKTFVHVLSQMHAHNRISRAPDPASREKS
jgi:hypothetical protein